MDLTISIDKSSGVPIYVQLAERIRFLVRSGELDAGQAMPTVRQLAVQLGVNANTVARVYRDLQVDGLLRLERGVGTFVNQVNASQARMSDLKLLDRKVTELIRLGRRIGMAAAEMSQFIETRWQEVD